MTVITMSYRPRRQFMPLHNSKRRWEVLVAHRRAGKTVASVNHLIRKNTECRLPEPQVAYIAPYRNQAKRVAWRYVKWYARPITKKVNESDLYIELINGGRVFLFGSDNADAIRGMYLDWAYLDEYGSFKPSVFSGIIRPALSDRHGGATFGGTPMGLNDFWEVKEKAESRPDKYLLLILRASETGIMPQSELTAAREDMTEDEYNREYECSFEAAHAGAIYGREVHDARVSGRIGAYPWVPGYPVHFTFDIGYSDSSAVWCWQLPREGTVRMIRFYQDNNKTVDHYCNWLHERRVKDGWQMGDVWLPHDAKNKNWQTGKSSIEMFRQNGIPAKLIPELGIWDGIRATRRLFPRMVFDAASCKEGVACVLAYHKKYDQERKIYSDEPAHNWSSHASDALRYVGVIVRDQVKIEVPTPEEWAGITGGALGRIQLGIPDGKVYKRERA